MTIVRLRRKETAAYRHTMDSQATAHWMITGQTNRLTAGAVNGDSVDLNAVLARWCDQKVAPNGRRRRAATGTDLVCAFDCSLVAVDPEASRRAFDYLEDRGAYTRVYNTLTGTTELQKLPGLIAVAHQHDSARDGRAYHHPIVPRRQVRSDGAVAAIDSMMLYRAVTAAAEVHRR
jgi:TrwC relaxase